MKKHTVNIFVFAVLGLFALAIHACGGSDPGIPITDGDDDSDARDFDFEIVPDYDVEWEELSESRCPGFSHNNDVTIAAADGGRAAYCLPGDALDGASLLLKASVMSADARLLISRAADFEMAEGSAAVGPAVRISAVAATGSDAVTLNASAQLTIPLYRGFIGSAVSPEMFVHYDIDGKSGILQFGAARIDGDFDGEDSEYVVIDEDYRYLIDAERELFSFPIRSFGIYQVAMPEPGARRK